MKPHKYTNYCIKTIMGKVEGESRNEQIRKFMEKFGNNPVYLELQNRNYEGARR